MVDTKENIKIVGEVNNMQVFMASCRWARHHKLQWCPQKDSCTNYVYGTMVNNEDPYIIGWCHDIEAIVKRSEAWVKMLQTKSRARERLRAGEVPVRKTIGTDPGYL